MNKTVGLDHLDLLKRLTFEICGQDLELIHMWMSNDLGGFDAGLPSTAVPVPVVETSAA